MEIWQREVRIKKRYWNLKFSKTKTKITHISMCQSSMNLTYSIHFTDFDLYCHLVLELAFPMVGSNLYLFLFFFLHLYWSIIALQWCVSFCCITKWISYMYTYIPISPPSFVSLLPSLSHTSRWSQSPKLISLC